MVRNLKREFKFLVKRCAIEGIECYSSLPDFGSLQRGFCSEYVALWRFNFKEPLDKEEEVMKINLFSDSAIRDRSVMAEVMRDLYEVFPEIKFWLSYAGQGLTPEDFKGPIEEIKQKLYKFW